MKRCSPDCPAFFDVKNRTIFQSPIRDRCHGLEFGRVEVGDCLPAKSSYDKYLTERYAVPVLRLQVFISVRTNGRFPMSDQNFQFFGGFREDLRNPRVHLCRAATAATEKQDNIVSGYGTMEFQETATQERRSVTLSLRQRITTQKLSTKHCEALTLEYQRETERQSVLLEPECRFSWEYGRG